MSMQHFLLEAPFDVSETLQLISRARHTYVKFLAPNDLGLTGSNQRGVYLPKDIWPFFLEQPGQSGENLERPMFIDWGGGRRSEVNFKWYGVGSRSEYRVTKLTSFFREREEEYLGALFLLFDASDTHGELVGRIVERGEDMEQVLQFLGITPADTGGTLSFNLEDRLLPFCESYAAEIGGSFPETADISRRAQRVLEKLFGDDYAPTEPDDALLELIQIEYALFRFIERQVYEPLLSRRFERVEDLLAVSLEINNRRKSRAGLALEYHLKYILDRCGVPFAAQAATEDQRRPDFLFPGGVEYHDRAFPAERLFFLGAKTTCKDRWRQILNEADRIPQKYLCTLQQGISSAQLAEMDSVGVTLVIPRSYHAKYFKAEDRHRLVSLGGFIQRVLAANGSTPDLFRPGG